MEEIKRLQTSFTMQIIKGKLYLKWNDADSGNIIKDVGKRVAQKCRHRNEKAEAQSKLQPAINVNESRKKVLEMHHP